MTELELEMFLWTTGRHNCSTYEGCRWDMITKVNFVGNATEYFYFLLYNYIRHKNSDLLKFYVRSKLYVRM